MGLQDGIIKITGTIDNLTFYKMNGKYYVRKKSSLTKEKVLNAASFERTRVHSTEFKQAVGIASDLYRPIKKEDRDIHLFRAMIGRGKTLLHKGNNIEQVIIIITKELIQPILDAKQKLQHKTNKEIKAVTPKTEKGFTKINQKASELNTEKLNNQFYTPELSNFYVDSKGRFIDERDSFKFHL